MGKHVSLKVSGSTVLTGDNEIYTLRNFPISDLFQFDLGLRVFQNNSDCRNTDILVY